MIVYRKEKNKYLTRKVSKADLTSYLRVTASWFHAGEKDRSEKSGRSPIVSVNCTSFFIGSKKAV
jgi:hypothetical protein